MKILICNVGSTSLKYRLFDMEQGEKELAWGRMERVGAPMGAYALYSLAGDVEQREAPIPDYAAGIERMLAHLIGSGALASLQDLGCVGFKVVHAKGVTGVRLLNEETLAAMTAFNSVAPSHNPPYIAAIKQFAALLPNVPLVGSFETGFHRTLPPKAYLYSIPKEVGSRYAIRRYGFHGASHEYVSGRVSQWMGRNDIRLISCHLGGSGSLCAVVNGQSVDTDLGFSLQCGLPHNNRCGDIDPYILIYLMEEAGYTLERIKTMLNRESGLLGLSGVSNDLRDVEKAAEEENQDAKNALEVYAYAIKKRIGAYAAAMGGLDAIAFAGGIGQNSPSLRSKCLEGLGFFGVELDETKNRACNGEGEISLPQSPVKVYVVDTNEEVVVARKAYGFLTGQKD